MKKTDAKKVITSIFEEINFFIEQNGNDKDNGSIDEKVFIDFLHSVANEVLEDKVAKNIDLNKLTFEEEYKDIAKKSINEYSNTSQSIEAISKKNDSIVQEISESCTQNSTINTEDITQKFQEIQKHITDELESANNVINNLTNKIDSLEKKSNLDPLTKVFNRRALENYFHTLQEKKIANNDLHVAILDIDDFKKVNDTYGHIAGDKVLIFLANLLKKIVRDGDKIFRYGGEEFILVLNRINKETSKKILTRILTLVRKNKLSYQHAQINITLSIGATQLQLGDTLTSVVTRADKALYDAKNSGKDQLKIV